MQIGVEKAIASTRIKTVNDPFDFLSPRLVGWITRWIGGHCRSLWLSSCSFCSIHALVSSSFITVDTEKRVISCLQPVCNTLNKSASIGTGFTPAHFCNDGVTAVSNFCRGWGEQIRRARLKKLTRFRMMESRFMNSRGILGNNKNEFFL